MGELIDRSVVLWRRLFGPLFRLYLVFQLIVFIFAKAFELLQARYFPLTMADVAKVSGDPERSAQLLDQSLTAAGAAMVLMLVALWGTWFISVAGTHFVVRRVLGEPASIREGLQRAVRTIGRTTVGVLLSFLWGAVVFALCLVPGFGMMAFGTSIAGRPGTTETGLMLVMGGGVALVVFGVLVGAVLYFLRFVLTPQVIALEETTGWGAFRRSGKLVSGRIGPGFLNLVKVRATILLTIVFAILGVVSVVTGAPASVIHWMYMSGAESGAAAIPQAIYVPAQLLQVVGQAIFAPVYVVFGGLLYVDLRVRREGLDLELKLRR